MDLLDGAGGPPAGGADPMAFMAPPVEASGEKTGMDAFADMAPPAADMGAMAMPTGGGGTSQVVKEWEAKMDAETQKKAAEELAIKKQRREEGKKALDKFHADRRAEIEKRKKTNRQDEAEWIKIRDDALKAGKNPWERVVSLIDDKGAKEAAKKDKDGKADSAAQAADTSHMKGLLIKLKNDPIPN